MQVSERQNTSLRNAAQIFISFSVSQMSLISGGFSRAIFRRFSDPSWTARGLEIPQENGVAQQGRCIQPSSCRKEVS